MMSTSMGEMANLVREREDSADEDHEERAAALAGPEPVLVLLRGPSSSVIVRFAFGSRPIKLRKLWAARLCRRALAIGGWYFSSDVLKTVLDHYAIVPYNTSHWHWPAIRVGLYADAVAIRGAGGARPREKSLGAIASGTRRQLPPKQ